MRRRALLAAAALAAAAARAGAQIRPRPLRFPQDFGAHPQARTEWWYATGALATPGAATPQYGFQVTFFRSRVDGQADHPSRFAVRQLVFAHAAVTDLAARRLRHDQRIARAGFGIAEAAEGDTQVVLRDWRLLRATPTDVDLHDAAPASLYHAAAASDEAGFALDLSFTSTQPLLLQGDAGWSRKGPRPEQASHYYSQPQLAVDGTLRLDGQPRAVQGRAWFDHEWSDTLLDPQAVGWDWIGMNLDDGAALTAFVLRRPDGSALWAGGSWRPRGGAVRNFGPDEVRFEPLDHWTSPRTRARYPVRTRVTTPAGRFEVRALLDDQELDSRDSTGSVYWEGLAALHGGDGARLGHGYLELTGYVRPLTM